MTDPRLRTGPYRPSPLVGADPVEGTPGYIPGVPAQRVAYQKYGGPTRTLESPVTFGTTVGPAVPGNSRRVHWTLVNLGVAVATISNMRTPSASAGIPLGPEGGFVSMDVTEDGAAVVEPWQGISLGAAGTGTLIEIMIP